MYRDQQSFQESFLSALFSPPCALNWGRFVNSIHFFHLHWAGIKMKKSSNEARNYFQNSSWMSHIYVLLFLFLLLSLSLPLPLFFCNRCFWNATAFGKVLVTLWSYSASTEENLMISTHCNGPVPCSKVQLFIESQNALVWREP